MPYNVTLRKTPLQGAFSGVLIRKPVSRILSPRKRVRRGLDDHLSGTAVARGLMQATKLALAPDQCLPRHPSRDGRVGSYVHDFTLTAPRATRCEDLAIQGCGGMFLLLPLPASRPRENPLAGDCLWAWEIAAASRIPRRRTIPCSRLPLATISESGVAPGNGVRTFLPPNFCRLRWRREPRRGYPRWLANLA